jgi:hypothetical protein
VSFAVPRRRRAATEMRVIPAHLGESLLSVEYIRGDLRRIIDPEHSVGGCAGTTVVASVLFTDLVDSTGLAQRLGPAEVEALRQTCIRGKNDGSPARICDTRTTRRGPHVTANRPPAAEAELAGTESHRRRPSNL